MGKVKSRGRRRFTVTLAGMVKKIENIAGNETRNVNIKLKLNQSPLSSYCTLNDQAPYPIDELKLKLLKVIQFEYLKPNYNSYLFICF